jgi:hypothetical protein
MGPYKPNISNRFNRFLSIRCRTVGILRNWVGADWARIAYNDVMLAHNLPTYQADEQERSGP